MLDLEDAIRETVQILDTAPVEFAYLFGSMASGEQNRFSDVDLAVHREEGADVIQQTMDLYDRIGKVFEPVKLDLIILNSAPISLSGRILTKSRLIYDRAPFRRHIYESLTLRMFWDFRIKEDAFFKARFAHG
ncbi:type VII toxin-antitoxin system MntA family adenylyltransferase antitoxin [Leptonema illini]|uniref:DNA polymerase beta domain protein region n=1 Tax=Leptonema illini DSM 21528 TaxID=929563 RepID=H2CL97_9LEPT|nr:nucleotidyltransferase domain-containing protein [Leptonema illini]EHQ08348.1 DNA polymerase beta domain protein region [Leptonema illini DSM 21528]